MKTGSTFVLFSVLFSACGASQYVANSPRVQVANSTQAKQERVPVASVPSPLASVSARASAESELESESESLGAFLYPDERIPVPKSNGILLANDTGLSPNPPLDTGCGEQDLPNNLRYWTPTFKEVFEQGRNSYIKKINQEIARTQQYESDNPMHDFKLKYAINRLEDPKPGVKVWQVSFFSDFATRQISSRKKRLYIGYTRITQIEPCRYMFTLNHAYLSDEHLDYPFSEDELNVFDYTKIKT